MKRLIALALISCLFTTSVSAVPAEKIEDVGWLFGGIHVDMNQSSEVSSDLTDLNPIAEDYTATWCSNCIPVEHALENVSAQSKELNIFSFHRYIGESEDPFGSEALDLRWEERYEQRLAPTVVMHGKIKKMGAVADSDSLEADFLAMAEDGPDLSQGTTSLQWNNSTMKATWSINYDEAILEGGNLTSQLWIVEKSSRFEDGSNGEVDYPHIVRAIYDLGEGSQGEFTIPSIQAYDGDDLILYLVHSTIPVVVEEPADNNSTNEEKPTDEKSKDDDDGLPGFSLMLAISAISLAAILRRP